LRKRRDIMTDHQTGTRAKWLAAGSGHWWRRDDEYGAR
jgi:hypothetical protein